MTVFGQTPCIKFSQLNCSSNLINLVKIKHNLHKNLYQEKWRDRDIPKSASERAELNSDMNVLLGQINYIRSCQKSLGLRILGCRISLKISENTPLGYKIEYPDLASIERSSDGSCKYESRDDVKFVRNSKGKLLLTEINGLVKLTNNQKCSVKGGIETSRKVVFSQKRGKQSQAQVLFVDDFDADGQWTPEYIKFIRSGAQGEFKGKIFHNEPPKSYSKYPRGKEVYLKGGLKYSLEEDGIAFNFGSGSHRESLIVSKDSGLITSSSFLDDSVYKESKCHSTTEKYHSKKKVTPILKFKPGFKAVLIKNKDK